MAERTSRSHPLVELTWARLVETVREPAALFWTFAFPVILAIGLGIAFASRPPEPSRVAILGSPAQVEDLGARLASDRLERVDLDPSQVDAALRTGRVDVLVVPGDPVEYRFDPTRPEGRVARALVDDVLQRSAGRADVVATADREVTEPGGRYIDFLVPGLIGLNIMSSSMWGTGYNIVLARRRKLLKRLAATPMRRSHFLLSFMLARVVFLVAEVVALLVAGWLLFHVGVHGSVLAVLFVSLLGAMSFMGLALLVASRPDDTEVASGWMNVVMLPMYILSGAFFSYERFPDAVHPFLRALPLTALNDALRALMNQGASLASQGVELGVLALWGLAGFVLALRFFRWQ